jgi:hypothetical protein
MSDVSSSQSSIRSMLLALIPTVILAFGSFVYTTVDTARRGRLEFVRGQIGNLYGPLHVLSTTSESTWHALIEKHKPNFDDPSSVKRWREYIAHVAIPLPFETIEP